MRVLLVSDPETERSAASMSVGVGHMSDPDNIPGLAHFLEHMLFLGTEKYPDAVSGGATLVIEFGALFLLLPVHNQSLIHKIPQYVLKVYLPIWRHS